MIKYIYNYEINQVYKSAIVSNIVACNIDCFFFRPFPDLTYPLAPPGVPKLYL